MEKGCGAAPEWECIWADGRAHAWFCGNHYEPWKKKVDKGEDGEGGWLELVKERRVKGGVVGERYGEESKKAFAARVAVAAEKYKHIDFRPPDSVAKAAEKGLEYRRKASPSNKGGLTSEEAGKEGIGSGVQRAVNLKNRDKLSPDTVKMMHGFFSRHEKNKAIAPEHKGEPWNDKGYVAWLLWGGDPGQSWAAKVVRQMRDADEKAKSAAGVDGFDWFFEGEEEDRALTPEEEAIRAFELEVKSPSQKMVLDNKLVRDPKIIRAAGGTFQYVSPHRAWFVFADVPSSSQAFRLGTRLYRSLVGRANVPSYLPALHQVPLWVGTSNGKVTRVDPPTKKTSSSENEPTNQKLWDKVVRLTKGEVKSISHNGRTVEGPNEGAGFKIYPSAYANGWAARVYKDLGGGWRKGKKADFDGSYMMIQHLTALVDQSDYLLGIVTEDAAIPDWAETQIIWAATSLKAAYDYFKFGEGRRFRAEDGPSYMSTQALRSIRDHAAQILGWVTHATRLPDWAETKITESAYWIFSVSEYMMHATSPEVRIEGGATTYRKSYRVASAGKHILPPLPYAYDALEPYISEETLRFHHDKHHRAYVNGLNDAEEKLVKARASGDYESIPELNRLVEFNWGGHHLHDIYWKSLSPNRQTPSPALREAIAADFGSWEAFREQLKVSTVKVRGSGWGVLVLSPSGLRIATVMNHENGVLWDSTVLLPVDAWEHAYYLDYQDLRADYFDAVFDNLINWRFVEDRLDKARDLVASWGPTVAEVREARGKAKKDKGHGGLDEWFSGHGGGDGDARWGDWVAISPVSKTLPSGKKVEKGDIVGPCGISDDPDWKEFTKDGEDPLKCMPRNKAYDMPKKERAEKAEGKMKAERRDDSKGKEPTRTPTFKDQKLASQWGPTLWGEPIVVSQIAKEEIPGGLARGKKPSEFDADELAVGIEVEKEHLVGDSYSAKEMHDTAQEIAMDHLTEIPDYYSRLKKMESEAEGKMAHPLSAWGDVIEDAKALKVAAVTGDGTRVGLFIPLPEHLASQFPSLEPFDDSPAHITFMYVGPVAPERQEEFLRVLQKGMAHIEGPITASLDGVDTFQHQDKRVAYSRVRFSQPIAELHDRLKNYLASAGFPVLHSFPFLTPHVTISYMGPHDEWEGVPPKGSWTFSGMQVWGLPELAEVSLGVETLMLPESPSLGARKFGRLDAKRESAAILRAQWAGTIPGRYGRR